MSANLEPIAEYADLETYRHVFFASPDYIAFSRWKDGTYIDVNPGFEQFTGVRREDAIGRTAEDLGSWVELADRDAYVAALRVTGILNGYQTRLRNHCGEIRDVETSSRVSKINGEKVVISIVRDITDRKRDENELRRYREELERLVELRTAELRRANEELRETNAKLEQAHNQLLQTEKMASIGVLAAGVAHEINNPVGFVSSNLSTLKSYIQDLLKVIDIYGQHHEVFEQAPERLKAIEAVKTDIDLDYLMEDIDALLNESADGLRRVKAIVQSLKDFSHAGRGEWQWANVHAGIDSTLNVVNNEIKYKATVVKEYGVLPDIECLPLELNQVFMNMLVNAAHAIDRAGEIRIRTGVEQDKVWVEFIDNGCGISSADLTRIFDPFFTTKPVGKGTGLGLSLSYGIIQKHHGRIEVDSVPGKGTCFRIWLPVSQPAAASP
ncbi:MAG TPA: ATP-binding protein [Noviherbaspirillum sp.]|nr:ATP-binding protein [Noviherbaspirillum sp.]